MDEPLFDPLTRRELEVLRLLEAGHSNREIAATLVLSPGTVKWYTREIYSKLGVGSRTQAVHQARELHLLDAPPEVAEARLSAAAQSNLPAYVTSFIGRQREIATVRDLLETARLLTLTGPGGTGKTRLAIQVAAGAIADFRDAVWFVDLAVVGDPELVAEAIAAALGVVETTNAALPELLARFLQPRQLLLVLDNFEHVLAAAPLIADLLAAAPGLRALVTSREPLQLYGEQEFPVPSLALPDPSGAFPAYGTLADSPAGEALTLFLQRARAVRPDFDLTAENTPAAAEICRWLDGLPLAIELAAARTRLFAPEQLLARLESRLKLLTGGPRDVPARQRTLRATIDWSYELLEAEEKRLFARFAVFTGGCTVDAVEAVCGSGLDLDSLEGLASLVNKSLIRQEAGPAGDLRFMMLATLGEYALERLIESGEEAALRLAHADYYLALAEEAARAMRGPDERRWIQQLEAEQSNLRAALTWYFDGADVQTGLRLVVALSYFWYIEGHAPEGHHWIEQAVQHVEDATPSVYGQVLQLAGLSAYGRGVLAQAVIYQEEASEVFLTLGDRLKLAWSLAYRGVALIGNPDRYAESVVLCNQALDIFRDLDVLPGVTQTLNILGELARAVGDYDLAGEHYTVCLALCRQIGERRREFMSVGNLGFVAQHRGDHAQAERLIKEALALGQVFGARHQIAALLAQFAGPAVALGRYERAARLLGASDSALEALSSGHQPGDQHEIDHYVADLRAVMDPASFEAARQAGRGLALEEAIRYALEED